MKLRTLDGKRVRGELIAEYPISTDGSPVLVVKGDPYGPEEAEFYLESASPREIKQLEKAGYDLPRWGEPEGDEELMDDDTMDEDPMGDEPEDD